VIDSKMLEQLAAASGAHVGDRPPDLREIFARVVADGWTPRNPAYESELDTLTRYTINDATDCLAPLLHAGDVIYVDHGVRAQSGDIVAFALSERGAALQNEAAARLGQRSWKRGDHWCKLLVNYRGFDMLLERHGGAATATLLGAESPDDPVALAPVRNIRRNGVLLFAPLGVLGLTACSPEINNNAATDVYTSTVAGPVNVYTSGAPGSTLITSITVPAYQWSVPFVVTVTGNVDHHAPGVQFSGYATVTTSATPPSGWTTANQISRNASTAAADMGATIAIENTGTQAAGVSTTFYLYGYGGGVSAAGAYVNIYNVNMKVEVLKK
jgi:hypothetical protein